MKKLTVISGDRTILVLEQDEDNGDVDIRQSSDRMWRDAARWIDRGLDEWIGTGLNIEARVTSSNSVEFFPRLKDYLERQFGFEITIDESVAPET